MVNVKFGSIEYKLTRANKFAHSAYNLQCVIWWKDNSRTAKVFPRLLTRCVTDNLVYDEVGW